LERFGFLYKFLEGSKLITIFDLFHEIAGYESRNKHSYQEEQKISMIKMTNTIHKPRAVVIHLQHTLITNRTVMSSFRLK